MQRTKPHFWSKMHFHVFKVTFMSVIHQKGKKNVWKRQSVYYIYRKVANRSRASI